MASPLEVKQVWLALCAAYPQYGKDVPPDTLKESLRLYQELLKDIDPVVLEATVKQHIAYSKWFPTIAELRTGALSLMTPQQPTALEAWGEVCRAISSIGSWSSQPKFSHPVIDRLVKSMGWIEICRSEMPAADRARFIEGYDTMVKRQEQDALLLPAVKELAARLRLPPAERKKLDAPQ